MKYLQLVNRPTVSLIYSIIDFFFIAVLRADRAAGTDEPDLSELSQEVRSLREMMVRSLADLGHILENVKEMQTQHEEILSGLVRNGDMQNTKISEVKSEVLTNRNNIGEAKLAISEQALKISEALHAIRDVKGDMEDLKEGPKVAMDHGDDEDDLVLSTSQSIAKPRDCADIQQNGATESGVYTVYLTANDSACIVEDALQPTEVKMPNQFATNSIL